MGIKITDLEDNRNLYRFDGMEELQDAEVACTYGGGVPLGTAIDLTDEEAIKQAALTDNNSINTGRIFEAGLIFVASKLLEDI